MEDYFDRNMGDITESDSNMEDVIGKGARDDKSSHVTVQKSLFMKN